MTYNNLPTGGNVAGFIPLDMPLTCDRSSARDFIFTSDNYPAIYPANVNCLYRVVRRHRYICRLEIDFLDFNVAKSERGQCYDDYLDISGVRYCGYRSGTRLELNFPPNTDEVPLRFRSFSGIYRTGGFRIRVTQHDTLCRVPTPGLGGIVSGADYVAGSQAKRHTAEMPSQPSHGTGLNGIPASTSVGGAFNPSIGTTSCQGEVFSGHIFKIVSPGFPVSHYYRPYESCLYTIKKSSHDVCAVQVKFDHFLLESSPGCSKDFLQINDLKLCGSLPSDAMRKSCSADILFCN